MELPKVEPGRYVVAVSGGVDSMVLLDILHKQPDVELVVAHFDHGIRPDSNEDTKLVEQIAKQYGLPFVSEKGNLGPQASEATARAARYKFLQKVQKERGAQAIITAHHQDDLLETAILNMLRGTGRKGLTSLASRKDVIRPLLGYTKAAIRDYGAHHDIAWREDSTNTSDRYLRNYIRHTILPRFSAADRQALLGHIESARYINREIDEALATGGQLAAAVLDRAWFIQLPYAVSCEALAVWLRANEVRDFDRARIERTVTLLKTKQPGKVVDVNAKWVIRIGKQAFALSPRES